jgi:hypothetical protein
MTTPTQLEPLARRWLTRTDAAEYMSVSPWTLDRWVAEGRLTRRHIADADGNTTRAVRFAVSDLDALVVTSEEVEASSGQIPPLPLSPMARALLTEVTDHPFHSHKLYRASLAGMAEATGAPFDGPDFEWAWAFLTYSGLIVSRPALDCGPPVWHVRSLPADVLADRMAEEARVRAGVSGE